MSDGKVDSNSDKVRNSNNDGTLEGLLDGLWLGTSDGKWKGLEDSTSARISDGDNNGLLDGTVRNDILPGTVIIDDTYEGEMSSKPMVISKEKIITWVNVVKKNDNNWMRDFKLIQL